MSGFLGGGSGSGGGSSSPTGSAGGDLSNTYPNPTVSKIQGKSLSSSISTIGSVQDGYVLTWVNANNDWEPIKNSAVAIVSNLAALSSISTSSLNNGIQIWVSSLKTTFSLDKNNTLTNDGFSIVTASSGGRWLRQFIEHNEWLSQSSWYINPASGNDENGGSTSGAALKTHNELIRRLGTTLKLPIDITVNILGNLPSDGSDGVFFTLDASYPGSISYIGTPTLIRSSTITSVIVSNPATQTRGTISDSVNSFNNSVFESYLFVDTTSNCNFYMNITTVTVNQIITTSPASPGVISLIIYDNEIVYTQPQAGDHYNVYSLPQLFVGNINIINDVSTVNQDGKAKLFFYRIDIEPYNNGEIHIKPNGTPAIFVESIFGVINSGVINIIGDNILFANCLFYDTICAPVSSPRIDGNVSGQLEGIFNTSSNLVFLAGGAQSDADYLQIKGGALIDGFTVCDRSSLYLSENNNQIALLVLLGGSLYLSYDSACTVQDSVGSAFNSELGYGTIWGVNGSQAVNIYMGSSSSLMYEVNATTAFKFPSNVISSGLFHHYNSSAGLNGGGSGDGGTITGNPFNRTTAVYFPEINITPANLDVAVGATGFGSSAINFEYLTRISRKL